MINFKDKLKNEKNIISIYDYLLYYFNFYIKYNIVIIIIFELLILLILLYLRIKIIYLFIYLFLCIIYLFIYTFIYSNKKNNICFYLSKKIIQNHNIKPIESKEYLLNKPLKEFYINTSHNSYISCTQNFDISNLNAIKNVLLMGSRCIELDINAINNIPVVGHGTTDFLTTSFIYFEKCIDKINKYGFLTSDPLILFLEVLTENKIVLDKIKEIIKDKFKNKLLSQEYKMTGQKSFINEPIKNLLNKIIIVNSSGNNYINNYLSDILDDNTYQIKNRDTSDDIIDNNYMKRIYSQANIQTHFSYNFDPVFYWKNKANFVALNFQTFDNYLFKNYVMFKNNSFVHFSEINFD
jgi:hypothetical protein